MSSIRAKNQLLGWITPLALFVAVYYTQMAYDVVRADHIGSVKISVNELIEPTIPSKNVLEKATFGLNTVIADLLWLKTIQYYGGGDPRGTYRKLPQLITSITALDPKFTYPYSFAGLILPGEGFSDDALNILARGEIALPDSWEIPYSEGTIYYINKKDSHLAAAAYAKASQKPGAPPLTSFLSAVQFDKEGNRETALAIFKKLAETSSNQYFKDRAQAFVAHYQLLHDLDAVIQSFHQHEHRFPTSLDELVTKRYVESIPASPVNRIITYDKSTGQIGDESKK